MNTVTLKGKTNQRMEMLFGFMMDYGFNSFATTKHFTEMYFLPDQDTYNMILTSFTREPALPDEIQYIKKRARLLVFQKQLAQAASTQINCYLYDHGAFSL